MKRLFLHFFLPAIFLFAGLVPAMAQGDLPGAPIKIEGINTKKNNNNNMLNLLRRNDMNTPSLSDLEEKKNFMIGEEFMDPGERYKKKVKTPEGENQIGATSNQFLGDFKSNGKFVKIVCRDHQYVDGDRVRIFMNDKVVQPNVLLDASYKGIYVDLIPGFNKIDFQALNQGSSGPNTAALAVFDDQGNVISVKEWNLATGVKATMIIVKEQ